MADTPKIEPEIRPYLLSRLAERMHVSEIQHIGGIQTYAVNVKLADPEADHIADIVPNRRIVLIQLNQKIVSAPVLIGKPSLYSLFPQKFTLQYQSL